MVSIVSDEALNSRS
jgi:very-short-patch-repair endonuclease